MCGGRGTRLGGDVEKPLVEVGGVPMVDRVLAALDGSRLDDVHAVVSPHAPATRDHLELELELERLERHERDCTLVDAPGEGYVSDLGYALELDRVETPVLTVVADLPLLDAEVVDTVLDRFDAVAGDVPSDDPPSLTVCVPSAVKRRLGASVDTSFDHEGRELAPTGVNVVAGSDDHLYCSHDIRLSVNVNRPADRELAEGLCD
ncbi:NTP transferase domain-containing protein [Halogranum rubrum]|uniref:Adenosylcobinamide-phosphate guanylyltransferase n=1 Tax=Halogranum salarium B-1 TaxID=1210908 RepID=J2ZJM0_9EURY|nr:NTP transferase domain-containing protein [Halogranum salarium]EJN60920.1 adenosylcobinamide-phosphate guanylyltransferase [Halogranum salarium B-1]